ncbi:hypothetical protein EI555_012309 [Monodon monoceros]|uniref:Histidine kinase/HSP90-like ATPase domain-containing protein n=1 Tax=Monodon monoceros TaxID=40151 RepID=A0A4U1EFC5_MONMO|nr:hypothetical protein EI555_012309 [Monodon monoceros]
MGWRKLWTLLLWGCRLRAAALAAALAAARGGQPVLCPWRPPAQSWSPRRSLASSSHNGRLFSSQATEERQEEPLHSLSSSSETVQGSVSKHELQAETKKLLDIVARSLYSEKEVFIRELISNASNALEKLRHKLVSEGQMLPEMEIHLQSDTEKGTITIQDTGIGMTQEELVSNLGTTARSGWKAFLDTPQRQAEASSKIIGQFEVCFYSAFMVADRVKVYSRSVDTGSPGYQWLSEGSGVFEIAEASGAIWLMDPKDMGETRHEEIYRYIAQAHDKPRYTLHYKTDAPLNIRSIFYAPETKPTMSDVSRKLRSSISLYSRQVLIQTKMGAARHFLRMRQLAKPQEERAQLLQPTLEINPRHRLIKKLNQLRDSEPDLAQPLVDQIYENAMITAGLDDDPRPMVSRLNHLLVKALD